MSNHLYSTTTLTYQVGLIGCMVLLRAHANKAIIVEEDAKRVTGSDQDVDAQVELVAFHQEGLVQVFLNDEVLLGWQLLAATDKRDPEKTNPFFFSVKYLCS